jgi:signal transduction histidine kinase
MGSRGRSIRLRIYFLVAIPLVTMLGLYVYVAYTSITNYNNLSRAPKLINTTAEQTTKFVTLLQGERRAAVVYLASPNSNTLSEFEAEVGATKTGAIGFASAMNSPATESVENGDEAAAIAKFEATVNDMGDLRAGVEGQKLSAFTALEAYTQVIAQEPAIFQAEAGSMTDTTASNAGLGLIATVNVREDLDEQDAALAAALAAQSITPQERLFFSQAAGREQDDTLLYEALLSPAELATFNATMDNPVTRSATQDITAVQQAVEGGASYQQIVAQSGLSGPAWEELTSTVADANYNGGTTAANAVLTVSNAIAGDARDRVIITGAVGLAGLILTLIVTILLGRSINTRLGLLRRSAIALATEQLPNVVARLRRGESVDAAAEAPPLRAGGDEIGQVGQAIDMVRQTAIRSAVDESRLRQGVNDMFRNLARRSQSLLQRQLTVLDGMERRATDPDVLDDLFKMDHLTTRMRRHAEGLIILSGAAPGRGWSNPVKLIDVMRGAVAEVEDFARVTVATQSKAALAGSAVTDVIHLLAELIENATTLSPPFTQVRVSAENVANGFAIEIEDRGLGMTPARMAELNERLLNPPDVNPANTEQLGLFVVGQLAKRHGINVMLRQSPYGGTTAVTLIPQRLVVDDTTPAITAGPSTTPAAVGAYGSGYPTPNGNAIPSGYASSNGNGNGYASSTGYGSSNGNGYASSTGYGSAEGYQAADQNGTGFPRRKPAAPTVPTTPMKPLRTSDASGQSAIAGPGATPHGTPPDLDNYPVSSPFSSPSSGSLSGSRSSSAASGQSGPQSQSGLQGTTRSPGAIPGVHIPGGTRQSHPAAPGVGQGGTGQGGIGQAPVRGLGQSGWQGSSDIPVVTGVPVTRPPGQPSFDGRPPGQPSFDVFTPQSPSGLDGDSQTGAYPNIYDKEDSNTYETSYGATYETNYGNSGTIGGRGDEDAAGGGSEDFKGLPRRVRQANLAPQLRSSRGNAGSGVPQAAAADPADLRDTLSAMQRGWQQARAQSQRDSEGRDGK